MQSSRQVGVTVQGSRMWGGGAVPGVCGAVVVGNKSGSRMELGFHLTPGVQPSGCAWD